MRRALLGAAACIVLFAVTANATLPVLDEAAIGQMIQQVQAEAKAYALQLQAYAIQAKRYVGEQLSWVKQAQQYATQLQQYAAQMQMVENWIRYPSLGAAMGLLNVAGLGDSLPISPYAVLSLTNGLRYGGGGFSSINGIANSLSGFASSAYTENHVYAPTDAKWASAQMTANANSIAGMQGAAQASYADLQKHQAALQALRDQLDTASPKAVADLQAEIALETTWTTNAAAQLQAIQAIYAAQNNANMQRGNEKLTQDFANFEAQNPYHIQ